MTHQLWLFRHAKSDWDTKSQDFDRPLSKRGRKNAIRIGQWMIENRLVPDLIISSPAERAFQTCEFLQQGAQGEFNVPTWDERLYLASIDTLLQVIAEQSNSLEKLMLVGHNPGLDELVEYLCGQDELPLTRKGKLMTTSTLAIIELANGWDSIEKHNNHLMQISRPKEILS